MEIFKYSKLASESGKDGLIPIAICIVLFAYFVYRMVSRSGGDLSQSKIIGLIVIATFLAFAANSIFKRLNSKGAWDITVDDEVIQWNAPEGIETSFVVNLDQVEALQMTYSQDQSVNSYDIIMSDGQEISLSEASGINFEKFATALKNRGIQFTEIEDHPSQ